MSRQPLIGIPACARTIGPRWLSHGTDEQYVHAVAGYTGGLPILIPPAGAADVADLARQLDGLFLSGSPSNVAPHHYGATADPAKAETPGENDHGRDAVMLPLIRAMIAAGKPLLAVCRGHQELNVAFGGTLHQAVHQVPGNFDHRPQRQLPREAMWAPRHDVIFAGNGVLHRLFGVERLTVNSLHSQAVDRPGERIIVEARAEDGVIEAIRVDGAAFAIGVQWHPEWRIEDQPMSQALFGAFGQACRDALAATARRAA
ncbi:MAG: gamma-glutamyl-gamma-aminobutyrate hydrolase family protein [Alphaproteobacteria bacterium]